MYAYLKGTLIEYNASEAVVDVSGVGFRISIPSNLVASLPSIGKEIQLHTAFVVRELSQDLYGFLTKEARDLFEALIEVNKVGPKLALSVIGHLSMQELQKALIEADSSILSQVPGIGKKTAQRLIIEMKDRLSHLFAFDPKDFAVALPKNPRSKAIQDAMNALINLGYNQIKAKQAIEQCLPEEKEEIELEGLIKDALRYI